MPGALRGGLDVPDLQPLQLHRAARLPAERTEPWVAALFAMDWENPSTAGSSRWRDSPLGAAANWTATVPVRGRRGAGISLRW